MHKSQVCVHVLFIRDQKILGSKSYFPSIPPNTEQAEVYEAFISQHYLGQDLKSAAIPKEIVIRDDFDNIEELTKLLSVQADRNLSLHHELMLLIQYSIEVVPTLHEITF